MPIGQVAIDSDVCVVHARGRVRDQAHQQRPPDSRIGEQLARGQSHRVEQIGWRKWIIDIARALLAQEHRDAQVERIQLASGRSKEMECPAGQRRLLLLIERIQNAQRRNRRVVVDSATLSTPARQALFEEIAERLVEASHPFAAHVAKTQRRVLFDELVPFEQVVGRLDRHRHQIVKLYLDQHQTVAQQRIGFLRA